MPQRRIRAQVGFTVQQQNMSLIVDRIETEVPIERGSQFGLGGQQAKSPVAVFFQDELRERRAQRAFAVENHDGALVGKARHGRIGSIGIGQAGHGSSAAKQKARAKAPAKQTRPR